MRPVIFVGLMLGLQVNSAAQTAETLQHFDEGNSHYAEGEYQAAIAAYEQAAASGFASAEMFYNMGNAFFRLDELGQAVLHYKRAERIDPGLPTLKHSLVLTSGRLTDQFSELPEPLWTKLFARIFTQNSTRFLTVLGLLFYVVGMGLIAFKLWSRSQNEWVRRGYSALLIIGLPLLLGGLFTSYWTANKLRAVVVVEATQLHEEASSDSAAELSIHEGLVVSIESALDSTWTMVSLPNGVSGWVSTETIVII